MCFWFRVHVLLVAQPSKIIHVVTTIPRMRIKTCSVLRIKTSLNLGALDPQQCSYPPIHTGIVFGVFSI